MNKIRELAQKLKALLIQGLLLPLKVLATSIRLILKPFLHPVTVGLVGIALGFLVGARMHETGRLAGYFQKDYKGATVTLSGLCNVGGKPRLPAFAEDEVKVTSVDGEKLLGVVRKTRESIECKLSEIAIDQLPLLANLSKSPEKVPSLEAQVVEKKERPAYKDLEKKTLVMTGSCVNLKNEILPPFTDEKVDITSVDASQESEDLFVLTGIKKSDKSLVRCLSNAVKYELFVPEKLAGGQEVAKADEGPVSYVGEVLLVSGSCMPDQRTNLNKKSKMRALFKLANTRIEVLEEQIGKDGRLSYIAGTVLDEPYRTEQVICDRSKIPFIYKDYDPEGMKLDSKVSPEDLDVPAQVAPAPATESQQ